MRGVFTSFSESSITAQEQFEFTCDEEYFPDDRNDLRPSDVVQSKLLELLPRDMAIPVSVLQRHREVRR
ncbi:hypothetical protein BH11PLA2_BH11PLA2_10010 [soil metagenome]